MKDMGHLVKEYLENTVMSTNQGNTKYSRNFLKNPIKTKMIKVAVLYFNGIMAKVTNSSKPTTLLFTQFLRKF